MEETYYTKTLNIVMYLLKSVIGNRCCLFFSFLGFWGGGGVGCGGDGLKNSYMYNISNKR